MSNRSLEPIDYRALLVKYMRLVLDREGITFLEYEMERGRFTDAENAALDGVAGDALAQRDSDHDFDGLCAQEQHEQAILDEMSIDQEKNDE